MTAMDPNDNNNHHAGGEMDGRMNGKDDATNNGRGNGRSGNDREGGARNGAEAEMEVFGGMQDQGIVVVMFMLGLASWIMMDPCTC
eukprot:CAMPEP_0194318586 /NCGR_PEP_ID=MMETSP0171-20130528/15166_1 /TAXON_ID=218684 /ORGANISM="Corethron pennatum, Strain L29A3" /LENGTH=85 /DNA_ID=CAMNT_0039075539 /DNA_START=242 /DNA_END=499 /DNA_ORIENTATION=+